MLWRRSISPRGEVYKRYRMGPRTEPWGTPHERECLSDSDTSIWTNWERSVKYDVNQSSALPLIPKLVDNRWSKIPWSTVSNAADRSSSRRTTHCWLSIHLKEYHNPVFLHFQQVYLVYCNFLRTHLKHWRFRGRKSKKNLVHFYSILIVSSSNTAWPLTYLKMSSWS